MLNYTNALYRIIGNRIKKIRKAKHLSQTKIDMNREIAISTSILSRAESGNAQIGRNPYLLNASHIDTLCKLFKITSYELIWGTLEEQEDFVKFLLLSILLNGNTFNPFVYFDSSLELYKWLYTQKGISEELTVYLYCAIDVYSQNPKAPKPTKIKPKSCLEINQKEYPEIKLSELKERVDSYLIETYSFFYSEKNFEYYKLLIEEKEKPHIKPQFDKDLLPLSNVLFKDLMHDYDFVVNFVNYATPSHFTENKIDDDIEQLLVNPSKFILNALDYKENGYILFIKAFNSMWERRKDMLMLFFTQKLFTNPTLEESGLKKFSNSYFDELIKSDELYQFCNTADIIEEYTDPKTILAKNYFQQFIQSRIQGNIISHQENTIIEEYSNNAEYTNRWNFWKYISKSMLNTKKCAEIVLKDNNSTK